MIDELERIWKEAVVGKFEVIFRNVSGVSEVATKSLSQGNRLPDLKPGFIGSKVTTVRSYPIICY